MYHVCYSCLHLTFEQLVKDLCTDSTRQRTWSYCRSRSVILLITSSPGNYFGVRLNLVNKDELGRINKAEETLEWNVTSDKVKRALFTVTPTARSLNTLRKVLRAPKLTCSICRYGQLWCLLIFNGTVVSFPYPVVTKTYINTLTAQHLAPTYCSQISSITYYILRCRATSGLKVQILRYGQTVRK